MQTSPSQVARLENGDVDPRLSILECYLIALAKEPDWRVKPLEPIAIHKGSGDVFADIGFRNPEQALAKAKLVNQIEQLIRERKLRMPEAAELIGINDEHRSTTTGKKRTEVQKDLVSALKKRPDGLPGTVMEILGHSNVQATMMIYREVTQDAKLQGIAKMDFLTLNSENTVVNPQIRGIKEPRSELRIGAL